MVPIPISIAIIVAGLGVFVGIPAYLYETGRISRKEILTVLAVELCLIALAQVVLAILRLV